MYRRVESMRIYCPKGESQEKCRYGLGCDCYDKKQTQPKLGQEEGETCNRNGCDGKMYLPEVEGCTCFNSPPCAACTRNSVQCEECGSTPEDD